MKKGALIAVRSSRTSYRFHSLHSSSSRKRSVQKGSKKTALSFTHSAALRFAPFVHSFADFLHILESSHVGLCASGARSNASTVSCSSSRSGRKKAREQSNCHTLRFVQLPVSAGGPIVAVSTLFAEAAKNLPRAANKS